MIKFSLFYFLYLTVIIITTYKNELVEIIYIININLFQRIKYFLSFSKIKKKEILSKFATIEDGINRKTTHMIAYSKLRYDIDRIKKIFACRTI